MLVVDRLQVAPKAGVADQRLVALGELTLQRGHDRGAVGGILLRLLTVAADDVAPPGQHHRLALVVDLFAALPCRQRYERRRIIEHQLAHQLVRTMILAVAVLAQHRPVGPLEVQAGGVHEHQVKPREQVAPMREQPLLYHPSSTL